MLLALKIDLNAGHVTYQEFLIFLKGGASLDLNSVKVRAFSYLDIQNTVNIILAQAIPMDAGCNLAQSGRVEQARAFQQPFGQGRLASILY